MIPLAIPNLAGNEAAYLQECISSGFVSSVGPFVSRFEEMVAKSAGTPGAVSTSAGTTGLHLALVCAGVRPGDVVIAPSFTFIATANAISHCGATPWLFDISADDWCLDPSLVRQQLDEKTEAREGGRFLKGSGRRVAALLPVYTLGLIPDMKVFQRLSQDYQLPLIADAAPTIGATRDGLRAGCHADISVFSFNGNKTITSGGGGALVSHNAKTLALAKHLSSTARVGDAYTHDAVGFNYRMTNVEAAVGCAQMEQLESFVSAKKRIRKAYAEQLQDLPWVSFFPEQPDKGNVSWFSGLVLEGAAKESFPRLAAHLNQAGIQCRPFWMPVHLQAPYSVAPRTDMPVCSALWNRVVVLPSSTSLTEQELKFVADTVRAFHP